MSTLEAMQAASSEADQKAEAENATLRELNRQMEETGERLTVADYSNLSARIEIAEMRAATAACKAQTLQQEVDTLRTAETARLAREAAQRAYDSKLSELNTTRAQITTKQQAIRDLQNEIPALASRQNILLMEIDKVRSALQQSA